MDAICKVLNLRSFRACLIGLAGLLALSCSVPSSPRAARMRSNEELVILELRTIKAACDAYEATYERGYPRSLAELGPYPNPPRSPREIREHFNEPPKMDAHHAGLIDEVLASGKGSGYLIIYEPVAEGARTVKKYTVSARPESYGRTGLRSFYLDQTGLISATTENRPATDDDAFVAGK